MNEKFQYGSNPNLVRRWQTWSFIFACMAVLIGLFGVAGWVFNSPLLRTLFSFSFMMRINTAIGILLAGISLLLMHTRSRHLAKIPALLALVITFLTVLEKLLKRHIIDHLFISHSFPGNEAPPANVPLATSLFAILLIVAVSLYSFNKFSLSRLFATAVIIFIYGSVLGLIFGEEWLNTVQRISGMAIHTALGFLFISLSMLFYRTDTGWMGTFSSIYIGGMAGRLASIYLIIVAPFFAGSYLYVTNMLSVKPSDAVIALVIISYMLSIPLVYLLVHRLNKVDKQFHEINNQLSFTNEELSKRNTELIEAGDSLKESNKELSALAGQLSDTTHQLSNKNLELLRTNEDLDNIVHIVSHDLKTPLTSLDASVKMFEQKVSQKLEDHENHLLDVIKRSVVRLKTTILDLTQALKSQKTMGEAQENVSIKEVLSEVYSSLEPDIMRAEAEIKINLKTDALSVVRLHLQSILHNLISNAVKYRSPDRKPVISIESDSVPEGVLISVSDNGLGIPPTKLPQLFSIFKRFHNHVEGSGIGLYIVKRIVENNHGRIFVDSEVDKGTTFTVIFKQNPVKASES